MVTGFPESSDEDSSDKVEGAKSTMRKKPGYCRIGKKEERAPWQVISQALSVRVPFEKAHAFDSSDVDTKTLFGAKAFRLPPEVTHQFAGMDDHSVNERI